MNGYSDGWNKVYINSYQMDPNYLPNYLSKRLNSGRIMVVLDSILITEVYGWSLDDVFNQWKWLEASWKIKESWNGREEWHGFGN